MSPGKKVALSLAPSPDWCRDCNAISTEIRAIRAEVLAGGRIAETAAGQIEYTSLARAFREHRGASGGYDQG
jgi:hypothetical protein